jgi:hypothetical protein
VGGVIAGGEHDDRLDGEVGGQGDERGGDQPQRPALPVFAGAGQFPEHHGGGTDLDQGVQPGRNRISLMTSRRGRLSVKARISATSSR